LPFCSVFAMPMVSVLGENLRWSDEVGCIQDGAVWKPKVTDETRDVDVLCFLNEPRVRHGLYEVPHYVVAGYYHDDGPPVLDQIMEGCRVIHDRLQAKKKVLVVCPAGQKFCSHRAFSALLTAAYPLLMMGASIDSAISPWLANDIGFRLHSWAQLSKPPPPRHLSLQTCLRALDMALRFQWLDVKTFDTHAFKQMCAQWDATWIIPGQILLLADPVTTTLDPDPATASELVPPATPNFFSWFQSMGISQLVRLNKDNESGLAKSYDANLFQGLGMNHIQAAYDDTKGGVPPKEILQKVINGCTGTGGVAFHCKAGFGRSGVCAAILAIHRFDLPGELLLAWLRICRPGTITTSQQAAFLQQMRGKEDVNQQLRQTDTCCAAM